MAPPVEIVVAYDLVEGLLQEQSAGLVGIAATQVRGYGIELGKDSGVLLSSGVYLERPDVAVVMSGHWYTSQMNCADVNIRQLSAGVKKKL